MALELKLCFFFFHSALFGAFLDLFGPFGAIFGLDFGFKKNFETSLCSLSNLALELQPYLFFFHSAPFGAFLDLFDFLSIINFLGLPVDLSAINF